MKTLNFGLEVETIGLGRAQIAQAIQRATGGTVGGDDDRATVRLADGRVWSIVPDASLSGYVNGEIVSPILTYADMDTVQNIVREVRKAGARVDDSTSIHVHVGAERFDAQAVTRMVKMINKYELLLEKALGVSEHRLSRYCRRVDQEMLRRLEAMRPTTLEQLKTAWYGRTDVTPSRYHESRYALCNVNSFFVRRTIEIRAFQGTLHAGEVKANIQFCLALAAKALKTKSASSKKRAYSPTSGRYDMRVWLLGLGLIGDEYKTARLHLTRRLGGSSAWKNGRPNRAAATPAVATAAAATAVA